MKTKFSGERPVMFYQDGSNDSLLHGPRVRIFYPDGHTEWGTLTPEPYSPYDSGYTYCFDSDPCWYGVEPMQKKIAPKSMKEAIRRASKWDAKFGYPKMKFLGEL